MSDPVKNKSKYEINEQVYFTWLFEKYNFSKGDRVLELACGEGEQWEGRITNDITLLLSDIDGDCVSSVTDKFSDFISTQLIPKPCVIDMQNMNEPGSPYDVIIANRALYMCEDIQKALTEIKRVLKPEGTFFTSTRWYRGCTEYLDSLVDKITGGETYIHDDFTLQNGTEVLEKHFSNVKLYTYDDSLHFSRIEDFMDYFREKRWLTIRNYPDLEKNVFLYIEKIFNEEGCVHISSSRGLFVAKNNFV